MKTISLLALSLLFTFNSKANFVVKTYVKSHTPNSKCFIIHVVVMDITADGTPWYVSSGDVVLEDCPCKMKRSNKGPCSKKKIDGQQFLTQQGTPKCLEEALENPLVYADFELQKEKILATVSSNELKK